MATPHYVYRMYDEDGRLLYVGISKTLATRLTQHHRDKPWADEIASVTGKRYATRDAARAAEIDAIHKENPRYNIQDRAKTMDWGETAASLWGQMDAKDRDEAIALAERFLEQWPEGWDSPSDRSVRTAMVAVTAMMRSGTSPTEALDAIYPERHRGKSRKLSPCPSCGQDKATHDDTRNYVLREHTAAFTCSPCDVTWTVNYDWNNGRPEVPVP